MFYGGVGGSRHGEKGGQRGGRNERFEQMTKQQQLIEQKKREIEAKLEVERQKNLEAALGIGAAGPVNSSAISGTSSSKTSNPHIKLEEDVKPVVVPNIMFTNDGSFMEQFRRLQEQKQKEEQEATQQTKTVIIKEEPLDSGEYGNGNRARKPLIKVMNPRSDSKSSHAERRLSNPHNAVPPPNIYGAVAPPPPPPPVQSQRQPEQRSHSFSNYNNVPPPPPPPPPPSYPPPQKNAPPGFPSQVVRRFAAQVAEKGDQHEDAARSSNNPLLWFLNRPDSEEYRLYRDVVLKQRAEHSVQPVQNTLNPALMQVPPQQRFNQPRPPPPFQSEANQLQGNNQSGFKREQDEEEGTVARKKRSRWGPQEQTLAPPPLMSIGAPGIQGVPPPIFNTSYPAVMGVSPPPPPPGGFKQEMGMPFMGMGSSGSIPLGIQPADIKGPSAMLSLVTRTNPQLLEYARRSYGTIHLDDEQWKQCEDAYKMNLLFQDIARKKVKDEKLAVAGKFKHEYDSDEEVDEGGTWEHKQRMKEMEKTKEKAQELTEYAKGKHHIGDFLPPEELTKFMDKYKAVKEGNQMTESAYQDFKIAQDNVGFKLLQKMGWSDGQGLGSSGQGITAPIDKGTSGSEKHGLGLEMPDEVRTDDDEYSQYRKRMQLAYRFRPNPLNNPRRAYY